MKQQQAETLNIHDAVFAPLLSEEQISLRIGELADEIDKSYHTAPPVVLPVLNGAFIFAADLVRRLTFDPELHFVKYESYKGMDSGSIERMIAIDQSVIAGKNVLIVEDIVDTGKTLNALRSDLFDSGAADVSIATLLMKPAKFRYDFPVDFVGFEIDDAFVVGWGLDYEGLGRSLRGIYQAVE